MKLGAIYSKEKTTFTLFSPVADSVFVIFYDKGNDSAETGRLEMVRGEGELRSIFSATAEGNLDGVYYTYEVHTSDGTFSSHDPYARACGVNGHRSMVIDLSKTDPDGFADEDRPKLADPMSMVITEVSIVDVSAGASAHSMYPGKFKAFTEDKTLSYFKDMGVTHLQLMPSYDFASIDESDSLKEQYNWGYDPYNYNVPEGSYSTDPFNGAVRVREYKEMVHSIHEAGLGVIMDVVYNHVYNASDFCVNQIVPGYFSRVNEDGTYSNGSDCGNDTASERSMVRKYIVDSVKYWADEYHIDGFRFDLVGLIDTETINEVVTEVHKTHPDVIFYGEGWTMDTAVTKDGYKMTTQPNSTDVPGFAFFSDTLRDALKGHVFYTTRKGYVSGAADLADTVKGCFLGQADDWCTTPSQSINYASCHDNMTLLDRITRSTPGASKEDHIRMNNLSAAIYMTAQGIPFLQAGEEMLRAKIDASGDFVENSYNSPDSVNSIKWDTLEDEAYQNVYNYYKGLIAFRKAHAALRLTNAADVHANITSVDGLDENVLAFRINGGVNVETSDGIFVIFNPNRAATSVALPDGAWDVCVNADHAGTDALTTVAGSVSVEPISAMVLVKKES